MSGRVGGAVIGVQILDSSDVGDDVGSNGTGVILDGSDVQILIGSHGTGVSGRVGGIVKNCRVGDVVISGCGGTVGSCSGRIGSCARSTDGGGVQVRVGSSVCCSHHANSRCGSGVGDTQSEGVGVSCIVGA